MIPRQVRDRSLSEKKFVFFLFFFLIHFCADSLERKKRVVFQLFYVRRASRCFSYLFFFFNNAKPGYYINRMFFLII